MNKRTKIVATISEFATKELIAGLIESGVNVIRLNTAHQQIPDTQAIVERIREVDDNVAILIDTKGAEVRTSSLGEPLTMKKGDKVEVRGDANGTTSGNVLYVTYPHLLEDVKVGGKVLIDDGDIELAVVDKNEQSLICLVENEGTIKCRKGVNLPNVTVRLPVLSPKDLTYIDFAIENDIDFIAHSFVQSPEDVLAIRKILKKHKSPIRIIAKIENQVGLDNIDAIIDVADGIMVARGDLGIEVPVQKIPVLQRELVQKCIHKNKAVIIATQMLHSMIVNPRPTRAEVNDVATAVFEKADALMLSGETATGAYPLAAVKMMSNVIAEVEASSKDTSMVFSPISSDILSVLANSAVLACKSLPIKAIIVDTVSGRAARFLSAYRANIPVYAFCYNKNVKRHLSINYGVETFILDENGSREIFLCRTIERLINKGKLDLDDKVVVLGGSFGISHGTSFLEISTVRNWLDYL